jgi:transposase
LEEGNIKLSSVASDVLGVSGRAMLHQIADGVTDSALLASLAQGRLREKSEDLKKALRGSVQPHQRLLLRELLRQVESLDESIRILETEIGQFVGQEGRAPFESAISVLKTSPGIGETSARIIISEIGLDMKRFGDSRRLCAWGGAAPANRQSAGKRLAGGKRHGNKALMKCLCECASSAIRMKNTYLHTLYCRIKTRRGAKRALIAVAHSLLRSIYHMLDNGCSYQELGSDHFDKMNQERIVNRLSKRLDALGYNVTLREPAVA